jgi:hypothetical protein
MAGPCRRELILSEAISTGGPATPALARWRGGQRSNDRSTLESGRLASMPKSAALGRVSRASPVHTAMRNCTRDEGGPFRRKRRDGFLVTCGDAAAMLDLVDESFDQVALLAEVLVLRDSSRAGAVRRDDGLSAGVCDGGSKAIGVVAFVREQVFEGKTADQAFCLTDIGDLAGRQDEADRIAESIDGNADLRAQAAARTPNRLIFAPPFWAPAACWCARTMVESMIRYSRSDFHPTQ